MTEYKDYKTGKSINREQYIKNGLERGELLYKYECGCVIIQDRTADSYIVYCYKHEAAPDLYEALDAWLKSGFGTSPTHIVEKAIKARNKADGKSS